MKYLIITFVWLISPVTLLGQDKTVEKSTIQSSNFICPDPNLLNDKHNLSEEVIRTLLKNPAYEERRNKRGLNNLNFEDLEVLITNSDGYACSKLNEFANRYKLGDPEIDPGHKLSYFKIDSTYFMVRWYDGNMFGFTAMYVFNNQFEPISIGAY
ncbi:MAG: hypothetical protein NXI08_11270 [bacterium]|nr:hypothetical protein [bacterium]